MRERSGKKSNRQRTFTDIPCAAPLDADYGFAFALSNVTRTDNRQWFRGVTSGNSLQTDMKNALHQGNSSTLNLYTVSFPDNLLGYATFPFEGGVNTNDDGVRARLHHPNPVTL